MSLYASRQKIYPRSVAGFFLEVALAHGLDHPDRFLRTALAGVECPPGGAVRPGSPPLLHLWSGPVPAGLHLPDRPAGHFGAGAVPVHRHRRALVVRLRLPADGLHRNLSLDREEGGRRPFGPHAAGPVQTSRPGKFGKKWLKHALWIVFSLWTGFTFVGYFTPIRELAALSLAASLGPWQTFWIFFYGFATYGNAGFMREQVCKYMCPYARFPERHVRQGHDDRDLRRTAW